MEIFHIAAECYPFAKVGGLGDVVGALPKYQKKEGHDVNVVIPGYDLKFKEENEFQSIFSSHVKLGNFNFPFSILQGGSIELGFVLYLVEIEELFDRKEIYGYKDDAERFVAFQIATLDWLVSRNKLPDIINCHDHHTGLIPFMMGNGDKYIKLSKIATVLTIHSTIYQGQFSFEKMYYLPPFDLAKAELLEWNKVINPMAAGVKCASFITTVSPRYLKEISFNANGLESLFKSIQHKSAGIINGIDTEVWNPSTDEIIIKKYAIRNFINGKKLNKKELCRRFNLDQTKPLYCFIGRLLEEKGADLLPYVAAQALSENYKEINFLFLGSGNSEIEKQLRNLLASFEGNYNVFLGYDEELAHLIYAGSDFLLMPSRIEPCGLNQMYAMKYGTIPIVRRTGGLADTVTDIGDHGNGICHDQASVADVCYSIQRAMKLFNDETKLNGIRKSGMIIDHSWAIVCLEYLKIYNLILNQNES